MAILQQKRLVSIDLKILIYTFYLIMSINIDFNKIPLIWDGVAQTKYHGSEKSTFYNLKISWKSKPDPNMAIPLKKIISNIQTGLDLRLRRRCGALQNTLKHLNPAGGSKCVLAKQCLGSNHTKSSYIMSIFIKWIQFYIHSFYFF